DVYAVNGVDLELTTGETLGLVGETGAGKTTLALSILRLLPDRTGRITQGEISYNGRNLLELDKHTMAGIRGEEIS
ncbi:ABC transporter ATP-binding protein, partial [Klebsiella oxytoca]